MVANVGGLQNAAAETGVGVVRCSLLRPWCEQNIPTVEQLITIIVMIDFAIDIGVKEIMYAKHWL